MRVRSFASEERERAPCLSIHDGMTLASVLVIAGTGSNCAVNESARLFYISPIKFHRSSRANSSRKTKNWGGGFGVPGNGRLSILDLRTGGRRHRLPPPPRGDPSPGVRIQPLAVAVSISPSPQHQTYVEAMSSAGPRGRRRSRFLPSPDTGGPAAAA